MRLGGRLEDVGLALLGPATERQAAVPEVQRDRQSQQQRNCDTCIAKGRTGNRLRSKLSAHISPGQSSPLEETYMYSPRTNLERSELDMLRTAQHSIDIAMYSFTDREIAQELAGLAHNGVRIRVYRDRTEYKQEAERSDLNTSAILIAAGMQVRIKGARDLMHLKSYCIDGKVVRTGSANWSPTGLKRQDNDIRYEVSPASGEAFESNFEAMWDRSSNSLVVQQSPP